MTSMVCFHVSFSLFRPHPGLGLIHVIRAFIDGLSRFVVGIQVAPNNRAATIFNLFVHATTKRGTPYRIRGARGVENALVADYMEDARGPGSYGESQ